jgi:YrbI family 3-deoxy-D-manno-octulosonate 8-phosphate phosphatase
MDEIDFARIELLVLDVDGVLTDGRQSLSLSGGKLSRGVSIHMRDETGVRYWLRAGRKLGVISGQPHAWVVEWARELGISAVRTGARVKLPALEEMLAELAVPAGRTAVMGDDLVDLPLVRACGFGVAVADAAGEVREAAAYVTKQPGGHGAVREVVELILRRGGDWDRIMERYRGGPAGADKRRGTAS